MKRNLVAAAAAVLLSAGALLAQTAEGPWTMEEFMATYPEVTPELFDQIDANDDGLIDQEELDAAVALGLIEPMEG